MTAKPKGPRHHSCRLGKPVRVVLRNGTTIYGAFKERSRRWCLLEDHPRIPWKDVLRFVQVPKSVRHCDPTNGTE